MNRFLSDVKKILLGQDGSEQMPLDFKEQITVSINNKIIDKAVASLLLATRNSVDKFGNEIDKKQIADVSGKGTRVGKENAVRQAEKEIKDEKIEKSNKEKEEEWNIIRDGNFYFNYGGNDPVSGRYIISPNSSNASYGFRISCIKTRSSNCHFKFCCRPWKNFIFT